MLRGGVVMWAVRYGGACVLDSGFLCHCANLVGCAANCCCW